jgi:hypothetical protein
MSASPTAPPTARPPSSRPPGGNGKPAAPAPIAAPGFKRPDKTARGLAIVVNGVEGFGKTTLGAFAPDSAFLLAPQESGYLTLFAHGLVPDRPYMSPASWPELIGQVDSLVADPQGVKTLVLDALGGFERLCHEHVCRTQFNGEWGEKGFGAYQKGYDLSVGDWLGLLMRLDRLRTEHGVNVLLLAHCTVKTFKNPLGADYDRFACDCHAKTWGVTHKWADAVLFGTFFQVLLKEKKNDRAKGSLAPSQRVIYTERSDAWDAKNRLGMPDVIELPDDPAQSWATVNAAINTKGGINDAI